ncbi:MAG: PepSY domain-containing protein [Aestuariibacter sp.]
MKSRRIHKIIGLILVLPMLGWTITGLIFFIKPGYQEAYEQVALKTYPLEQQLTIKPASQWEDVRLIKTILGHHLLVKINGQVEHLDPVSLEAKTAPSNTDLKLLVEDALSSNKSRYGDVVLIDGTHAQTSTGIDINLDWSSLRLSQNGDDTKLINLLYKIHYLQWSPFKGVNQILGIMGLLLLITLTVLGIKLYIKAR